MFTVRMCISKQSLENNAVFLQVSSTASLDMNNNDLPAFDLPSLITVLRVIDVYTLFLKPHPF